MKKLIALFLLGIFAFNLNANIFSKIEKIDTLDYIERARLDFSFDYIFLAEVNPLSDLSPKMRKQIQNLHLREKYPDAWRTYSSEELEDFSYFGYKQSQVKNGTLNLKTFLEELQNYINFKK